MVAIGRVGFYSASSVVEGNMLLADSSSQAVLSPLSIEQYNTLDPDKIAKLSELYEAKNPNDYLHYKDLRDNLRLKDREFHLQSSPGLQVGYAFVSERLRVMVTKPFSDVGVAASIKVYVFDGAAVLETVVGESNIQGQALFQITQRDNVVILIFAKSGSSVGFNATTAEGWDSALVAVNCFVKDGALVNPPSPFYIFSYADWKGPLTQPQLDSAGYPLPILIVWKSEGYFCHLVYPHLPTNYGPESSVTGVTLTYLVRMADCTFHLRFKVWGAGGE